MSTSRLRSLDAFRGLTVAGMILVNNPGTWGAMYPPLAHAEWNGWTPTDLIFPFFVFIMGMSAAMVIPRRLAEGVPRGTVARQVVVRSLLLFLIGFLLAWFPRFDLATVRIPGVLVRLAACYFAAGLILTWATPKAWERWIAVLLLGYWVALLAIPVPGYGAGVLAPDGNLPQYIDAIVLGAHRWKPNWDPEGILSTFPAIATCLIGAWTWDRIRAEDGVERRSLTLMLFGAGFLLLGWAWSWVFPINKNLWSSSYVLWTAGMAMELLALMMWVMDGLGRIRWARPFEQYGKNALALFVLSGLFARALSMIRVESGGERMTTKTWIFSRVFLPVGDAKFASLLFALSMVLLFWGVAAVMERKGWYWRL
jgi:predicted acyltransferase